MPTNDFVPFSNSTTNVMALSTYDGLAPAGNITGIANSSLVNRALRQSTTMAAALTQFMMNVTATSIADNNNTSDTVVPAAIYAQLVATFALLSPVVFEELSGSGTTAPPVYFFTNTPSVAPGMFATYKDANNTVYLIQQTTTLYGQHVLLGIPTSAFATPPASGVLTNVSGTGDATITFYATRLSLFGTIYCQGGGGGGGGCATAASSGATGGGGGGGAFFALTINNPVYTGYAWVVGGTAAGGVAGNNNGTTGNASSWGVFTANAGANGLGSAAITSFTTPTFVNTGLGGAISLLGAGTDWSTQGGAGTPGAVFAAAAVWGSAGGSSFLSGITRTIQASSGSNNSNGATNSGGGGSGGVQAANGGATAGGIGAAGYLFARWYFQ